MIRLAIAVVLGAFAWASFYIGAALFALVPRSGALLSGITFCLAGVVLTIIAVHVFDS